MDLTEIAVLGAGSFGAVSGLALGWVAGLRWCGPRLNSAWTERHPVQIAEDVRAGRQKMRHLAPHTQLMVSRELQALNTGRPEIAAAVPLVLRGVAGRYAHLSADALDMLSAERTPAYRRAIALAPRDAVVDAEWIEFAASEGV
jgi:hypothetical protein